MNNIMWDIETLDVRETAVILEYSYARFDPMSWDIGPFFTSAVNYHAQHARSTSSQTIDWWEKTEPQIYESKVAAAKDDKTLLSEHAAVLRGTKDDITWAHGYGFDVNIMDNFCLENGVEPERNPFAVYDTRTFFKVAGDARKRYATPGQKHNAEVDVFAQIRAVQEAHRNLYPESFEG